MWTDSSSCRWKGIGGRSTVTFSEKIIFDFSKRSRKSKRLWRWTIWIKLWIKCNQILILRTVPNGWHDSVDEMFDNFRLFYARAGEDQVDHCRNVNTKHFDWKTSIQIVPRPQQSPFCFFVGSDYDSQENEKMVSLIESFDNAIFMKVFVLKLRKRLTSISEWVIHYESA